MRVFNFHRDICLLLQNYGINPKGLGYIIYCKWELMFVCLSFASVFVYIEVTKTDKWVRNRY